MLFPGQFSWNTALKHLLSQKPSLFPCANLYTLWSPLCAAPLPSFLFNPILYYIPWSLHSNQRKLFDAFHAWSIISILQIWRLIFGFRFFRWFPTSGMTFLPILEPHNPFILHSSPCMWPSQSSPWFCSLQSDTVKDSSLFLHSLFPLLLSVCIITIFFTGLQAP